MILSSDTILYFSGTGNSLQVAKDISIELGNYDLQKIATLIKEKNIKVEGNTLGIVFPVYYARLPLILEQFIKKLEISKDTYIFAVATHGGGPATVLIKLRNVLKKQGILLNSSFLIHMPRNHVFAYNIMSVEKQNRIFINEKKKVIEIVKILRKRKNCECEVSKLVIDRIVDRVFISTTDRIMNKLHANDKNFWVLDSCTGCKLCEKICPVKNIKFIIDKPTWNHNCEQCTACIQYCPNKAIQWGKKTMKRNRYRNPNVNIIEMLK